MNILDDRSRFYGFRQKPVNEDKVLNQAYLMICDLADRAGLEPDDLIQKYHSGELSEIGKTSAAEVIRQALERTET